MPLCPQCGRESSADASFCAGCGTALAAPPAVAREERKVVTVLFADLVGSTARAESLDPEDVRAILAPFYARLRAELERHGGTVEKFIGDAVMAVFGAPVVHEDDAERAVRAALAIRDAIGEGDLEVRIGVHTGEALVTLGARPLEGEGMVAGDVVNTAARIQSAAQPNTILVGAATRAATGGTIDYREHEPVRGKGKAQPIAVWEAVQATSRFGVDVAQKQRAPLIGRERERDLLVGALARTRTERAPQLVTIVGAPGLGKSRLVHELLRAIDEEPDLISWRQGRSLPYGDGVTFWALGEMVKAQAGILESDDRDTAAAKLGAAVEAFVAPDADAQWVTTHLRPLVGLAASALSPDRRAEAFTAWRRFFESLAEHRPLVLVFEDVQWADDALLDFVDHLVDWVGGVPLLVVCVARPELLARRAGWGGGKRNSTTISLAPLTDTETATLLSTLLDRRLLPADVQQQLLERAGGNPLYAEEYARILADGGPVAVPETLQGIIAARLDALDQEEKTILQEASILGKVFWLGALEAVPATDRGSLEERLHHLERKEFVKRERRSSIEGDVEYAFLHVLLRDVAYGQIPRAERAAKHARAAGWLESLGRAEDTAEMLAHHYVQAVDLSRAAGVAVGHLTERARLAFRDGGDRAFALGSYPTASALYTRALDLWPADDVARPRLLLRRAESRSLGGDVQLAELREAAKALVVAGDAAGAAVAEVIAAGVYFNRGERAAADEHADRAHALVADAGESPETAGVVIERARLRMIAGDIEAAIEACAVGLAMAERLGLDALVASALITSGQARGMMDDVAGLDQLQRGIEVARSARSPLQIHRGLNNLGEQLFRRGRLDEVGRLYDEMVASNIEYGFDAGGRWWQAARGEFEYIVGDWDAGLELLDGFLAHVDAGEPHYLEGPARACRARIRQSRGDARGALSDAARALDQVESSQDPQNRGRVYALAAAVLLDEGREADAAQLIDAALELKGPHGGFGYHTWVLDLAWLSEGTGWGDLYDELLRSERLATPWIEAARAVRAGDHAAAAAALEAIGARTDAAFAHLRAAEVAAATGDAAAVDAHLEPALAFYRSVGAIRYLRRAELLLAATG